MSQPAPQPAADPSATPAQAARPVVVVGAGPVGLRVAAELAQRQPSRPLLIFGEETWAPYDRIQLSALLAGTRRLPELQRQAQAQLAASEAPVLHLGRRIVRIEPAQHRVIDHHGDAHRYATLVLATGSRARVPGIPGIDLRGVFTLRDLSDAQALAARQLRSRATVVIGGGPLGLECARAMQRHHTQVTVVDHNERLMHRQLDAEGAAQLREHVGALGVQVRLGARTVQICAGRDGAVAGVVLADGERLACDTVVVAAGIVPRIELARAAGIAVGRGIRVDDRLQTSVPDIYAIGECAEHDGQLYGLVAPGFEQAAVAAEAIAGGQARYVGTVTATQLKILGRSVYSLGELGENPRLPGARHVHWRDAAGRYRKLVLYRGRAYGVIAIGPWPALPRVQDLVRQRRRVWPWQVWRFRRTGFIWDAQGQPEVSAWPAGAVVCNCTGVTRGRLSQAVGAGCASVAALGAQTGAGTVCGSCQPLLAGLVGGPALSPQPAGGHRQLAGLAGLTLAAVLAVLLLPAIPYASSFPLAWHPEVLWRDGLLKQVSGFSVLGLALLALPLSLRKRLPRVRFGRYPLWRLLHALVALLALLGLWLHTGGRLGDNLNAWLMLCVAALMAAGAAAAAVTAFEHRLAPARAKRWRRQTLWLHLLASWPLPALLGFHVLKTYYY